MSLLEWNDRFSIGLQEIDNQHKRLIDIINKLHDVLKNDASEPVADSVFFDLHSYTKEHFSAEEASMSESGFPDVDKHAQAHRNLETQLEGYRRKYDAGDKGAAVDLAQFLMTWLVEHMLKMDGEYGEFLRKRSHVSNPQ